MGAQLVLRANLEAFIGADARELRDRLLAAESPAARFCILEDFVATRSLTEIPRFVRDAVARIEASHGSLRVADLHRKLDVSRKHLAVSCTRYVGVSAKSYAQIQRFLWTLEAAG